MTAGGCPSMTRPTLYKARHAIIPISGLQSRFWLTRRTMTVEGTLLASNLGFPEGPVIMPDGSVVFCDGNTGEMRSWKGGELGVHSVTGGSPWGAVLGTDGAIYVTQGGNVPGSRRRERRLRHPARKRRRQRRAALLGDRRPYAGRPQRPRLRARRPAVVHRLRHRAETAGRGARHRQAVRAGRERRRRDARSSVPTSTPTASRSTRRAGCTGRSPWRTPFSAGTTAR